MLPYVVKLDPPIGRAVSVPRDANEVCRAEICFDEARPGGVAFAVKCMPKHKKTSVQRRFNVGDRVACAVEDANDRFTDWAAGVVLAVDHTVDVEGAPPVPFRVRLDEDRVVLVHRDEHWLIRDSALQAAGPRQAADGTRALARFVKRQRGDTWEMVDHATRKVRVVVEQDDDDDSD